MRLGKYPHSVEARDGVRVRLRHSRPLIKYSNQSAMLGARDYGAFPHMFASAAAEHCFYLESSSSLRKVRSAHVMVSKDGTPACRFPAASISSSTARGMSTTPWGANASKICPYPARQKWVKVLVSITHCAPSVTVDCEQLPQAFERFRLLLGQIIASHRSTEQFDRPRCGQPPRPISLNARGGKTG